MADYFRERTRLWAVAGVIVGAMLTAWDLLVAAPSFLTEYAVRNDFRLADAGALVAAAVATAWWLIRAERQLAAGVVLSLLVLKPQLALLVPLALLVGGYRKTFAAWLVASAVIGIVALALLGTDGVTRYRDVLGQTQTAAWDITRRYSISGPLCLYWPLRVADVAVVVVTVVAACRQRRNPNRVIAAGIVR